MNWFITRNDDMVSSSQPCGFLTHLVTILQQFIASCILYNVMLMEIIFCNLKLSCVIRRNGTFGKGKHLAEVGTC